MTLEEAMDLSPPVVRPLAENMRNSIELDSETSRELRCSSHDIIKLVSRLTLLVWLLESKYNETHIESKINKQLAIIFYH